VRQLGEVNVKATAKAHTNLGVTLAEKGWLDEAVACFREALRLKPDFPRAHHNLVWLLVTWPRPRLRDRARAVALARKAVELAPKEGNFWNTVGVAHYRAGDWKAAVAALERSVRLRAGGDSADFFLAMARWRLGDKEQARVWYGKTVAWMDQHSWKDPEQTPFRAEATQLSRWPEVLSYRVGYFVSQKLPDRTPACRSRSWGCMPSM
jgi:eukaryotic-like serine/threonine-protein kinase